MALGATERGVLSLVMRQGFIVALTGLTLGIGGAWGLTRFMQAMLFGVDRTDPVTFGGVTLILATAAIAATVGPARRAARVDPTVAMRAD
jgi:ABC-type antimicrobial peptide transport system permease subunit